MLRRRSVISANSKKTPEESIDAALLSIRLTSAGWRVKASTPAHALRRARLAGDVLHHRDGAFTDECNRHRLGAHALARDAAGGVGGVVARKLNHLGSKWAEVA